MKFTRVMLAFASVLLIVTACKKQATKVEDPAKTEENNVDKQNLVKIGETYIPGASARAVVFGTKLPETGFNDIFVALYDSSDGSSLSRGHFDVTPVMDMGSMIHTSPVENTEDTVTTNGYFKTGVVFSMPGSSAQWKLNMYFHNHKNDKSGIGSLSLEVKASDPIRFKSTTVVADSNANLYLSLVSPVKAVVGVNDFEIVLHKKVNGMTYVPVDNYTIEIEPTMPSMGHGSPNNVNPVLLSEGHYKGKVNFTMSGLWRIKIRLFKQGNLVSEDQFFEITI